MRFLPWFVVCAAARARIPNIVLIADDPAGRGRDTADASHRTGARDAPSPAFSDGGLVLCGVLGVLGLRPQPDGARGGRNAVHLYSGGSTPNLPTLLRNAGYATGCFGKSDPYEQPASAGFDYFLGQDSQAKCHDMYPVELDAQRMGDGTFAVPLPQNNRTNVSRASCMAAPDDFAYTSDVFEAEALAWIANRSSEGAARPFFAYLAYTTPHAAVGANGETARCRRISIRGPELLAGRGEDHVRSLRAPARPVSPALRLSPSRPPPPPPGRRADGRPQRDAPDASVGPSSTRSTARDCSSRRSSSSRATTARTRRATTTALQLDGRAARFKRRCTRARALAEHGVGPRAPRVALARPWAFWDVLPTLAELANASDQVGADDVDGASFAAELTAPGSLDGANRTLYFTWGDGPTHTKGYTARRGDYKGVVTNCSHFYNNQSAYYQKPSPDDAWALYDLAHDPSEERDIAAEQPDIVAALRAWVLDEDLSCQCYQCGYG